MSKKVSLLLLTISCGCFGTSLLNAALTEDISNKADTTKEWWIDRGEDNKATFKGQGAIEAINDNGSKTGANIKFVDGMTDDDKRDSLLTIDFQNDPTIDVEVNKLGGDFRPIEETENVGLAHIYAHAKNGDAVALHIAEGVNLKFTGDTSTTGLYKLETEANLANQKRAGIFAYSNSLYPETTVHLSDSYTAVGIELMGGSAQTVTFTVPTRIYVKSDGAKHSGASGGLTYSAAAAIGKVISEGNVILNGNIGYDIRNNNEFLVTSSSSNSEASAVAIGGAVGSVNGNNVSISGTSTYKIGDSNILNVSSANASEAYSDSSAAVIGASVGYIERNGNVSVSGDSSYEIGTDNTLNAVAAFLDRSGYSYSSAVIIGISVGDINGGNVNLTEDGKHKIQEQNILNAVSDSSSAIVGISVGCANSNSSVEISGNSSYEMGERNTLSATANSPVSYSSSMIIGASVGRIDSNSNVNVGGSREIIINSGNILSSLSETIDTQNEIYSAAGVFGAACSGKFSDSNLLNEAANTARGMSINLNGSQTISALVGAFRNTTHGSEKVSVFGADDTDKQDNDAYGWRVGIYNEEATPAVVNILGAKLAEQVVFTEKDGATTKDAGTATVVLNADQGTSYQDYARAFALGKDFQIYIGGKDIIEKDDEKNITSHYFERAGTGTSNVVNIFGAIAPAQYAELNDNGRCSETKLVVDNNWTANVYAPIEGLEKFTIKNGAVVNAFDHIQKIGSLRLKGGTLHLKVGQKLNSENDKENCLKGALMGMTNGQGAPQLTLTHEVENGDENNKSGNYAVRSIGLADDYEINENRFAKGGKLVLGDGEVLRFYVNSDLQASQGEAVLADGYITVESGLKDAFDFAEGSKIELVNVGTQPIENKERKFILIRGEGMTVEELLGTDDFNDENLIRFDANQNIWVVNPANISKWPENLEDSDDEGIDVQSRSGMGGGLARMMRALVAPLEDEPNAGDDGLHVCFEQTGDYSQMVFTRRMTLSGDDDPTVPGGDLTTPPPSLPGVGSSSAQITTVVTSMFRNAIGPRLAGVRFRGDGAFIYGIGGHVHQSSIAGIGYGGDLYGVAAGADKLLNHKDGCVRLGAMIGYIYGDIDFHGSAIGKKQKSKQDNYLCALYGSYGSINEKNLKTDLNLSCGFGYTKHRLNRVDQQGAGYDAKMKSNNFFLSAEFIKNLYAVQGIQFGLWLRADYNHIHQKAYSEYGGAGAQSISKAKFDFLDTTIGVNIEKEIQNSTSLDRSLRLYMKAGWNCQPMRSHSTIVAGINGKDSVVSPHFGSHNSAVFTAGLRQKLNARWDLIGEWNGSFNKKHSNNLVTLGAGYTF